MAVELARDADDGIVGVKLAFGGDAAVEDDGESVSEDGRPVDWPGSANWNPALAQVPTTSNTRNSINYDSNRNTARLWFTAP